METKVESAVGTRGVISIARVCVAFLVCLLPGVRTVRAQQPDIFRMMPADRAAYFAKIGAESEADWRDMIDLLHLAPPGHLPPAAEDPNRPGISSRKDSSSGWHDAAGNTYARSPWGTWNNYDESKANPYPILPDPLVLKNGRPVKDPDTWWNERRPQILADFNREIFGREPERTPAVRWELARAIDTTIGKFPVSEKQLVGHVDNSAYPKIGVEIQLTLVIPARPARPVPVVMEFGFILPPGFAFPGMPKPEGPSWQEQVLEKGWAYAVYVPTTVQPDNAAGLAEGIIGLVNRGKPRSPGDWGALRAWAWGASRALDCFEADRSIDAKKVCIEGVSRYGKAVLVTMAYDQRFAIALVGSSGKGGAALYRRNFGESMGNICSSGEFHWFAGNLLRYVLTPDELSVDSHELIALCAPRPVFISCGSPEVEGRWIDGTGQFMAAAAAGGVYALLGRKGLGTPAVPPIGTLVGGGALAFRQHQGGHTVGPNWPYFLQFAQEHFGNGK